MASNGQTKTSWLVYKRPGPVADVVIVVVVSVVVVAAVDVDDADDDDMRHDYRKWVRQYTGTTV